jgi:TonB family protein
MESDELDRWRRVQELFEAAADLRPSEQEAYLATACAGEDALRQEVEALLRSDAEAGSFIEHAIRRSSDLLLAAEPDPLEALGKIGKYEILGRIGEGGFGIVYKGRDAVLQRYVAVKTCSSRDEKLRRRFFREGQIAAGLQHPNITTVYDLGVERGIPYLVQEFLAGEDLNHKIARQEGLTTLRRLDILVQVARGLEYAHLQGVLHRDIKPANIRILPPGGVKIMDFGIAKLLHEVSDVTTKGVTLGTVGYLAPEQLRGEEVDRRTDIFSFGVLGYELLSYRRPFPGSTFSEVSYRLLNEEPAALGDLAPVYCRAITEMANRCLAKNPADRYESFAEVIAVLEPEIEALRSGSFPISAGAGLADSGQRRLPEQLPSPWRSRWSSGRVRLGAGALAVAMSFAAGGWALLRQQPPRASAPAGAGGPHRAPDRPEIAAVSGRAPAAEPGAEKRGTNAPGTAGPAGQAKDGGRAPAGPKPAPPEQPRGPLGSGRRGPSAPRPTAGTAAAGATEGDAQPRGGAEARDAEQEGGIRGEPAEEARLGPGAGSGGGVAGAAESAGEKDVPIRQMVRGDLIPPGAPNAVPPRLVSRPEPQYPDRARRRQVEADVLMLVLVDENGRVLRAIVQRTDDTERLGFNEAARLAALRATFNPASRDGLPGKMWTELPFSFRIRP